MKVRSKTFDCAIAFLVLLITNNKVNSTIIASKTESDIRTARRAILQVKEMTKNLKLSLHFWFDYKTNTTNYYLSSPIKIEFLQDLSYKQLSMHLPYIVMLKLLFNQKVNYRVLSQDNYKCSSKQLQRIISALRDALVYMPTLHNDMIQYDIKYVEAYNSYQLQEVTY